jgi:hypothetical protein
MEGMNVRNGHQADLFTNVSLMSAVGGIADTILLIFQRFELPVSAHSGQYSGLLGGILFTGDPSYSVQLKHPQNRY